MKKKKSDNLASRFFVLSKGMNKAIIIKSADCIVDDLYANLEKTNCKNSLIGELHPRY